ncbi:MAG: hypothetical protein ACYC99_06710, partial [Candidatus Geothermincolia bacterium]
MSLEGSGSQLYAGCNNGQVYRYDGGGAWTGTGLNAGDTNVLDLIRAGDYLYAGCFNGHAYRYDGSSWTDAGAPGSGDVSAFAWDGTNLYEGGINGHVYKYEGGTSWSDCGDTGSQAVMSLKWSGTALFAGGNNGRVYQYGGGTSWNDTGLDATVYINALEWDGATLYAGSNTHHVYSYAGGTWSDTGDLGSTVLSLNWTGSALYAGCWNGHVYRFDGGTSWIDAGNTTGAGVFALSFHQSALYAGCDSGHVYRYDGGNSWTDLWPTGGRDVTSLCWHAGTLYAACDSGRVFRLSGDSWTDTGLDEGGFSIIALVEGGPDLYVQCGSGNVYRLSDTTWTDCGSPDGNAPVGLAWNGSALFYGDSDGNIFKYDGGTSWTGAGDLGGAKLNCMAGDSAILVAGCNDGHVFRYEGGTTWTDIWQQGSSSILAIAAYGSTIYASCVDRAIHVFDGSGWNDMGYGWDTSWAHSLVYNGTSLYAGCGNGDVYRYLGGTSWMDTGNTSGSTVRDLAWNGESVFAGGGRGVFEDQILCTVSASVSGGHGSVNPGIQTVTCGTGATVTINPEPGYHTASVIDNGTAVTPTPTTSYTISGVVTDHDVVVTFAKTMASAWYLAEGTNAWGFSTYITIENPNNSAVTARLTYMDPNPQSGAGVVGTRDVALPPLSQTTISSEPDIGAVDFSTKVECLQGKQIAVDRTMFWTGPGALSQEGHSSIGTTTPSKTWYLPEGSSNWNFETWTLIQNPNATDATVKLTYMTEGGTPQVFDRKVPAHSRASYDMAKDIGSHDASIKVTSDVPVIAEGSMYRNDRREGSCSTGASASATDFFLAEGATGYDVGFTTYVLIQNPNDSDVSVTLTYQTPSGAKPQAPFTMAANSRKTVRVNDQLPVDTNVSTAVHGSKPIIAERSMYWGAATPLGEAMHASIGLDYPHMTFYLPDGQTSDGHEAWTLVQNPNPGAVTVRITYLPQGGGTPVSFTDEIPPGTRSTYNMADK